GLIGAVAVATKHEIVLAVIGGLFVLEAVSVIVQVVSFKLTGKRVFKMAPIHHHFEQLGWTEPQIVIRFWIVSVVLALAGLSSLKLRGCGLHRFSSAGGCRSLLPPPLWGRVGRGVGRSRTAPRRPHRARPRSRVTSRPPPLTPPHKLATRRATSAARLD